MRYFGVLQYKGTNYCGWQKQTISKLPSIQDEVETVLSKILNANIKIYGSGRTDAGVHALGQTFHFDSDKEIDSYKFVHSFNQLIPNDIVLLDIKKVDDSFHARFSAKSKTYLYKIINEKIADPFNENLALQLSQKLDIDALKCALNQFKGVHNFQNYTSKENDEQNFVREIYDINVSRDGKFINIELTGNGFMRYMVRMIVGTAIQVSLGKLDIAFVEESLLSKERNPSSFKASAMGLYLEKVNY